jgi:hypothetical protein
MPLYVTTARSVIDLVDYVVIENGTTALRTCSVGPEGCTADETR